MTGSEVEKLLEEARALLHVPGVGKALKHKILELKATISRNIEYFQDTGEDEAEKKPGLKGKRFKITRVLGNLWIPSIPDNPRNNIYQVIPQPVVDYIVDHVDKTGVINMQKGLTFPGLKGRVFDLSFERHNDYLITGIIRQVKDHSIDSIYPDNLAATIDLSFFTGNSERIEVIKLLAYYLSTYDDFYDHVVSLFKIKWKLLIDNQILSDINAESPLQ